MFTFGFEAKKLEIWERNFIFILATALRISVRVNMDTINVNKLMSWLEDLWSKYCPSKWIAVSIVALYAYYK